LQKKREPPKAEFCVLAEEKTPGGFLEKGKKKNKKKKKKPF